MEKCWRSRWLWAWLQHEAHPLTPQTPSCWGHVWELGVLILAGGGPPLPHAHAWPSPGITSDSLRQRVHRAPPGPGTPVHPRLLHPGWKMQMLGAGAPPAPSSLHDRLPPTPDLRGQGSVTSPTASPAWRGKAALWGWPLSRCQLQQGSSCSSRTWETDLGAPLPPPVPGCELGREGSKLKAAGKG